MSDSTLILSRRARQGGARRRARAYHMVVLHGARLCRSDSRDYLIFPQHCQIIPDDLNPDEAYASSSTTVTISVQAFTPILGTLLLSSNPLVGGAARFAVVDLLSRMKRADVGQLGAFHHHHHPTAGDIIHPWEMTRSNRDDDDNDEPPLAVGLFGSQERAMFTQEILYQVVVGIGKLDVDYDPDHEHEQVEQVAPQTDSPRGTDTDRTNPYFPPLSSNVPTQASARYSGHHSLPAHETALAPRPLALPAFSPGTQFPPNVERSSPRSPTSYERSLGASPISTSSSVAPGSPIVDINWDEIYEGDEGEDEQAAVGRISSMSLMAAVTASGVLDGETQRAFVTEVERVGRDAVFWVRREASFALGALAKVVPEEVVIDSLLPLFDALRWDSVWHVRHSALFALPAILVRLSPAQRRTVALETIVALSADHNPTVRSGVLEALGEVIYTFCEDADGPPEQLINLFIGRKEDRRVRDGQQLTPQESRSAQTPMESFYADPKRPLICAFNFPAVALTLGGRRWGELRDAYVDIASDTGSGVRRTLAASLGVLANIVGQENAVNDLVDVWWACIKFDEEEIRMKAIESLRDLIAVVGREVGQSLVQGLLTEWNKGSFRAWRERQLIEENMVSWANLIGLDTVPLFLGLLFKGLEDTVATVRETATSALPKLWNYFSSQKETLDHIRDELQLLATSSNYRRRMTFIACQQTLALCANEDGQGLVSDEDLLRSVVNLANDDIEGVRIAVARFAALLQRTLFRDSRPTPKSLRDLVQQLSQDSSQEVQSYVVGLSFGVSAEGHDESLASGRLSRKRLAQVATFSRPPLHTAALTQEDAFVDVISRLDPSSSEGLTGISNSENDRVSTNVSHYDDALGEAPSESLKHDFGPTSSAAGLAGMKSLYTLPFPDTKERFDLEFQSTGANASERVTVPG
ncbi:hypothetical protein GALMADRAFT_239501 [Galerina marginata CBS 339.88]|uniref:TOG domain-containing protein n=1 Tax=Galerina marginata (strain CBS 339.88) TaxID=685588 RepID=A0A067TE83_GALM3|nr:hypothetical protein GALMADRAFT_239501 [Galerina marginata CBS 339.88]